VSGCHVLKTGLQKFTGGKSHVNQNFISNFKKISLSKNMRSAPYKIKSNSIARTVGSTRS
jgi:hypothetical protein